MRGILVLLAIVVIAVAAAMYFGLINIDQTRPGVVQAPKFDASVAKVSLGTENKTVAVPTISVQKPAPQPTNYAPGMLPLPAPMRAALNAARAAAVAGEVPVGAVVTLGGTVIATAANQPRTRHDPTAHAEILAIRAAASALGRERLEACDLWVTLEPCAMCAGAIAHARIARLYYAAPDPKGGAIEHGPRLFAQPTIHHRPEVYAGIGEREAAALLREFFESRR